MVRAKVDTQREERAKRESQIVIDAERAAREAKTARMREMRLAAQSSQEPDPTMPKPTRRRAPSKG